MFIEPTITRVSSGFSGYIWLDTKIVLKKMAVSLVDIFSNVKCIIRYNLLGLILKSQLALQIWFTRMVSGFTKSSVICLGPPSRHRITSEDVGIPFESRSPSSNASGHPRFEVVL